MLILQLNETAIDLGVLKEMRNMYERLFEYEEQVGEYLNYVAIKKDSIIGHYLITHVDNKIIINEYLFIDQKKIINAIDIALLEKNQEMFYFLFPLFKNIECGIYDDLKKYYSEDALNYILEHDSFQEYLQNNNGKNKQYVVYEDGKYFKNLSNNKVKKIG